MTQEQLNKFYSKVSFSGMLYLYALKLSLDKKMAFDRDHLAKALNLPSSDYFHGFLVACSSFDIVNYNFKDKVITVTYLDSQIDQTILAQLTKKAGDNDSWKGWITKIVDYFK